LQFHMVQGGEALLVEPRHLESDPFRDVVLTLEEAHEGPHPSGAGVQRCVFESGRSLSIPLFDVRARDLLRLLGLISTTAYAEHLTGKTEIRREWIVGGFWLGQPLNFRGWAHWQSEVDHVRRRIVLPDVHLASPPCLAAGQALT